jgi:threonine dehydrogenase-like Zn-dependent dehydrogenase
MRGLWLSHQALTFREDLELPKINADEALIRVRMAGICRTDLELSRGYYPFDGILGHEFVGEVVEAPGGQFLRGDRVVGEINASCGDCALCRKGLRTHCLKRTVLGIVGRNGAFADFLALPAENLLKVPASIPDEVAVFVEPIAAAFEILEQLQIPSSERVLLIGAGKLGQLIAQVLSSAGLDPTVVARYPLQQELLEQLGIRWIDENQVRAGETDLAVEATGSVAGLELALSAVRPRGRIILKSTYEGRAAVDLSLIVVDEISLIGSRCGPFAPALRLLEERAVDPRPLISFTYPFEQALTGFETASESGVLKVLYEM